MPLQALVGVRNEKTADCTEHSTLSLRTQPVHQTQIVTMSKQAGEQADVLVAEDDPMIQGLLIRILTQQNYRVRAVGNGVDALSEVATDNYKVAVFDVRMPGIDGIEVARRYRETNPNSQTKLIALTADVTADTLDRCKRAGFDECLTKPIRRQALLDHVESMLTGVHHAGAARPAESPEMSVIDINRLRDVLALEEDASVSASSLVRRFLDYAQHTVSQMSQACVVGDFDTVTELAHRLEGSAGSIGASLLANQCSLLRTGSMTDPEQHHVTSRVDAIRLALTMTQDMFGKLSDTKE